MFGFTYFYTAIIFHPQKMAENLQKQGGFIPGIRPGRHTSEYLANTTHKIIFVGSDAVGRREQFLHGQKRWIMLNALRIKRGIRKTGKEKGREGYL